MRKIVVCLAILLSTWGFGNAVGAWDSTATVYAGGHNISSYLNGDTNYRCVWAGGRVSQFVDLSSAVTDSDGITAIFVRTNNDGNDEVLGSSTYTLSCDGSEVYFTNVETGDSGWRPSNINDPMVNAYRMLTGAY